MKRLLDGPVADYRDVKIPGFLVDYVVLAPENRHPQTYGTFFDPAYTGMAAHGSVPSKTFPLAKRIVAHRAALELANHPGANVNLGIGIPALIGAQARELGLTDFTLTVESGLIGGVPDEGLSFGAVRHPRAVIEQSALFDFYDGGGIDLAFLGFAQADGAGNVNVSKFNGRIVGSGGFINISQSAKHIVFCGTLTADGLRVEIASGRLRIVREGRTRKFHAHVAQLTFNGRQAAAGGKTVLYVTERAVFRLGARRLELIEFAPGIDVADIRDVVDCDFHVAPELKPMSGFANIQSNQHSGVLAW